MVSKRRREGALNIHWRTFPLAVFLRNLFCEMGRSCLWRLRMVMGGWAGAAPAVVAIVLLGI